jgi:cell wall-associated NlpC family hydrolase
MNLAGLSGLAATALLAPLLGVALLAGGTTDAVTAVAATAALCATSGPVTGLDAAQADNARLITAVTAQQVAPRNTADVQPAALIALITAYQESRLRDLANPTVPRSQHQPAASGTGRDHDSLGLFQQRGSWGSVAQRMDPAWATTAFLDRLLTIPGWRSRPPAAAAQAVQHSADPDAYAKWEPNAQRWLTEITHGGPAGSRATDRCGGDGAPARGTTHLPAGFTLPPATSPAAAAAVTFALAQLGKPYSYGAAGPDTYDCSGLTMAAWATAGIALPHYTVTQAQDGTPVATTALLRPGDLVFTPGDDGTLQAPGHVGMYIANNLIIEAPQTGDLIKIISVADFTPIAAMRHIG